MKVIWERGSGKVYAKIKKFLKRESDLKNEDQEGETFRPLLAAPTFYRQTIGQDSSNNSSRAQPENLVIPNRLCKELVQPFFVISIL